MTKLSKIFTRQGYSLFFCSAWSESDCVDIKRWLGVVADSIVMVREGAKDKMTAWYDIKKAWWIDKVIEERVAKDDKWFSLVVDGFYKEWNVLLPYIKQEKKIKSVEELENYYRAWVRWWSPMAILYEIPGIEEMPAGLRDEALRVRKYTQDLSDDGGEVIVDFFKLNFPELSGVLKVMMPNEMFVLKERGIVGSELDTIRARLKGWVLMNGEVVAIGDLDKELKVHGWELEEEKINLRAKKISGQTVYAGRVRGRVRLVVDSGHIEKFQEGEVLVTEMTTPEFVPAMKKAVAIVTDEGGICCHAAIVSREMKKPCVIGTRIATKVLKDGDLVEVYAADKGIVRKL